MVNLGLDVSLSNGDGHFSIVLSDPANRRFIDEIASLRSR